MIRNSKPVYFRKAQEAKYTRNVHYHCPVCFNEIPAFKSVMNRKYYWCLHCNYMKLITM